ncbi:helix-turn-helix transcriptional regulator [Candidatus Enterococcus courvalinii]|uniref:Helix-turn-helix transcriptional regulator n=1 Tax=Candidatus Enterococcus courvalinii TaxID=2815329 RepID=A0ABS3HYJ5_9ENTE|nr:helix-turn-helix transcriptional regulator [Enterococcus sp. MSG2901]MBO0481534.1 helix-turn-helix transcriptional regulator [Enterococcus sp. MSG2901]
MSRVDDYIQKKSLEDKDWKSSFEEEYNKLRMSAIMTELRESTGMNKSQFAELVGKPRTTIDRIEKGKMNPSTELMDEIATRAGKKLVIKIVDINANESVYS